MDHVLWVIHIHTIQILEEKKKTTNQRHIDISSFQFNFGIFLLI